jgi:hypothetical protein
MEKRYVMLWNGGLYHGRKDKNIFTLEELAQEFRESMAFDKAEIRNSADIDDDHELSTLDELFWDMIEAGSIGAPHYIWETDLCERGDDHVVASLVSVQA